MTILFKGVNLPFTFATTLSILCLRPYISTSHLSYFFSNFFFFFFTPFVLLFIFLTLSQFEILFYFLFVMYRLAFSTYLYGLNIHANEKAEEVIADNHHFPTMLLTILPCHRHQRLFFNICVSNSKSVCKVFSSKKL